MAMLPNGAFDANKVEPRQDFDPIPDGDYTAMIMDSGLKPTKNNTGQFLEITLQVLEGQYKGRLVWDRLNLVNRSEQAQEIAQRTLSSICRAVGVMHVSDSAQLHNKPMKIRVALIEETGYKPKNEITSYKSASAQPEAQQATTQVAPSQPAQQQAAEAAPQASNGAPPWAA